MRWPQPETIKEAKRLIWIVAGFTLLLLGLILLFLPGPGIPLLILALGILAGEFVWARRMLEKVKALVNRARRKAQ